MTAPISLKVSVAPATAAGHLRHECVYGQILMGPSALRAAVTCLGLATSEPVTIAALRNSTPATNRQFRPPKRKRPAFGQLCRLSSAGCAAMVGPTAALESCAFAESVDARPASPLSKKQRSKVIARVTRKSLRDFRVSYRAYLAPAEGSGLSGVVE